MKAIFILPALLAFIVFFVRGFEKIYYLFQNKPLILKIFEVSLLLLLSFYLLEIVQLIIQLYHTPSPF